MALTRTLAQLRDAVQRTADVVAFTDRHPTAYLNDLVNRGIGALHRQTAIIDPEFRPLASTTITADGSSSLYPLPAAFRSLISAEYTGGDGVKVWLLPYEMHERAALADDSTTTYTTDAQYYKIIGSNIELLPTPAEDHETLLWYATTASQLTLDGDQFDVYDRLDDYIIWWAAREIADERGDWERSDRLSAKIAAMTADIQTLAHHRDLSGPARIVDLRQADRYGRGRFR